MDDISNEEYESIVSKLIEMGVLEIVGYDTTSNQFMYNITPECEHLLPELWEEHFKFVNELAFQMWNEELIEMNFDKDGTPMVMLKPETVAIKDTLPDDKRVFIENMLKKYKER